jgi:hypothetical protein
VKVITQQPVHAERLAGQRGEIAATRRWRRVIWVIEERTLPDQRPNPLHAQLVRASCSDVQERAFPGTGTTASPYDVTVLVCDRVAAARPADQEARATDPAVPSAAATSRIR